MRQYTESYGSPSTQIQNIVANDLTLLDSYILVQTGQYEWTAQIFTLGSNKTREIVFTRTNSGYNNYYTVTRRENIDFNCTFTNEFYVFSNLGYGNTLDLPIYDGITSWSLMIISCILMFAVVFKGWLFKCLRKRR